jgi:8-oxo-dGTP pyrophosphatase MutT (NUDIX family)
MIKLHAYATAGGVVLNRENRILLLERRVEREEGVRHEIRLPKGHIEAEESAEQAAMREVCEESGYCDLTILAPLGTALVAYTHQGNSTIRQEHYFLMRLTTEAPPQPNPQGTEELLFQPRWASDFAEAIALLTYPAEQNVMQQAFITAYSIVHIA